MNQQPMAPNPTYPQPAAPQVPAPQVPAPQFPTPPAAPQMQPPMPTAPSGLEHRVAVFQDALRALKVAEHDLANAKAQVLGAKEDLIEALDYAGV